MMTLILLAAEEAEKPAAQPGGGDALTSMLPMFVILMVVMYFTMIVPQKREAENRRKLAQSLKKNDRVVTESGIVGTISNFSPDGREVTLRLEEGKVRVLRAYIRQVLNEEPEGEKPVPPPSAS